MHGGNGTEDWGKGREDFNSSGQLTPQAFKNKYHYGCLNNWIVFFGLANGRSFWRHVLFPSSHRPHANGMDWDHESFLYSNEKFRTFPV